MKLCFGGGETGSPLVTRGVPRVGASARLPEERGGEVDERDDETGGEDGGAERRHDVQHLELRGIVVIAARHPTVPEKELREERDDEPDEHQHRRKQSPALGVKAPRHFRPPVVERSEPAGHRAAHHDEVESARRRSRCRASARRGSRSRTPLRSFRRRRRGTGTRARRPSACSA